MNNEHWISRRYKVKNHAAGTAEFDYDIEDPANEFCLTYGEGDYRGPRRGLKHPPIDAHRVTCASRTRHLRPSLLHITHASFLRPRTHAEDITDSDAAYFIDGCVAAFDVAGEWVSGADGHTCCCSDPTQPCP